MRKFHVHESLSIPVETARAFEYPGRMYLNRWGYFVLGHVRICWFDIACSPLIQILEDLGIPRSAFLDLQSAAVTDIQTSRKSLLNFAGLLEAHALGRSYSLAYIIRSLDNIGCDFEHHNPERAVGTPFIRSLIDTAVLSVLRGLKHNARIPVPKSWNLVGIADESNELDPGEIYGE